MTDYYINDKPTYGVRPGLTVKQLVLLHGAALPLGDDSIDMDKLDDYRLIEPATGRKIESGERLNPDEGAKYYTELKLPIRRADASADASGPDGD